MFIRRRWRRTPDSVALAVPLAGLCALAALLAFLAHH